MANNTPETISNREIVQSDALTITEQHKRCGLGISMGVGKTRIAIQHLQKYYDPLIKVLVVVPKLSVKQAWLDELDKMNLTNLIDHIDFTTYLSLKNKNLKTIAYYI